MSRTKKFERRFIALTQDNIDILKVWMQALDKEFGKNDVFDFDMAHAKDQEGLSNRLLSWTCDVVSCAILDSGKQLELHAKEIILDVDSFTFLESFELALTELEIKHQLPKDIDKDKYKSESIVKHYFAVVKEVLMQTMALSLQIGGDIDKKATRYLSVFNTVMGELSKLDLAFVSFGNDKLAFIRGETYTKLFEDLSTMLVKWYEDTAKNILSVKELNKVNNTIESNLETLDMIKTHIQRHLYCRLLLNEENRDAEICDLLPARLKVKLSMLENKLLSSNSNNVGQTNLLPLTNTTIITTEDPLAFHKEQKIKIESIYSILDNKTQTSHTPWIKKLYSALTEADGLRGFLIQLSSLTTDIGSLLFLFKSVNTAELSGDIKKCINNLSLCIDPEFKGPGLTVLELKTSTAIQIIENSKHDFNLLDNNHCQRTINRVKNRLEYLEQYAQLINNPNLIDLTTIYKLNHSVLPPSESHLTNKQIMPSSDTNISSGEISKKSYTNKQSVPLNLKSQPTIKRKAKAKSLITEFPTNKDCLFVALGLKRGDELNLLFEKIKENSNLQAIVSNEASKRFKNTLLPQKLAQVLSDHDCNMVDTHFIIIERQLDLLCSELRKKLEPSTLSDYSGLNKFDFILKVAQKNPKVLEQKQFKDAYTSYIKDKAKRDNDLIRVCANKDFITAYLTHYYLDEQAGFTHTPGEPSLLSAMLTMKNMPVQIWVADENKKLTMVEQFNLTDDNSMLAQHLLYYPDTDVGYSPFQRISPPEENKTKSNQFLKKLLAETIEDASLDTAYKKEILNYFCINNKTISETGLTVQLNKISEAERQIELISQQLELHETFYKDVLHYVLQQIKQEIVRKLERDPRSNLNSKLMNTSIQHAMTLYFLEEAAKTYEDKANPNLTGTVLYWNEKPYWIDYSKNTTDDQPQFKLYLKKSGLYYGFDQEGINRVFNESTTQNNKQCGLTALGTTREEFVKTLTSAINHKENREYLSSEIHTYLNKMHQKIVPVDKTLMTDEIALEFNNKKSRDTLLNNVVLRIETELKRQFKSPQACLTYLLNTNNHDLIKKESELSHCISLNNEFEKKILAYCNELTTCQAYVTIYQNDKTFWIDRKSARLYAQEKEFTLNVYDKPTQGVLPILTFDKWASHQSPLNHTVTIVYENERHFNALLINNEDQALPESLWEQYTAFLKQHIIKALPVIQTNMSIEAYQLCIDNFIKDANIATKLNATDPRKIKEIVTLLDQKKDLIQIRNDRKTIMENFNAKTIQYLRNKITEERWPEISDLAISINDPLDKEMQTMLFLAVKKIDIELVSLLLVKGASVATTNYPSCNVEIEPIAKITSSNCYLLTQNNKQQWEVEYKEEKDKNQLIAIDQISGLPRLLDSNKAHLADDDKTKITQVIKAYHAKKYQTTPLMTAAKTIGFVNKAQSPLFFSLLTSGLTEVKSEKEGLDSHNTLKNLSENLLTPKVITHFEWYIGVQEANINNDPNHSIQTKIQNFFYNLSIFNKASERGIQLAELVLDLIKGEINHNYKSLIANSKKIDQNSRRGRLFTELMNIIKEAETYITQNEALYDTEYEEYTKARLKKSLRIESQESANANIKEREYLIKEAEISKEARRKTEIELEKITKQAELDKIESDKKDTLTKKEHEEQRKQDNLKNEENINLLINQINLISSLLKANPNIQKQLEEQSNPSDAQPMATTNNLPSSEKTPHSGTSALGMFGKTTSTTSTTSDQIQTNNNLNSPTESVDTYNLETLVTTRKNLSLKQLNRVLFENNWEMCEESNFFTAVANVISNTQGISLTESDLRTSCANYYAKSENKSIVQQLNIELKHYGLEGESTRQTYELIQFNALALKLRHKTKQVINGLCGVEGVLLCRTYDLPGIFEIIIGKDDSVQYAFAGQEGYSPNNSPADLIDHLKSEEYPILLSKDGQYYCMTRALSKEMQDSMSRSLSNEESNHPISADEYSDEYTDSEKEYNVDTKTFYIR